MQEQSAQTTHCMRVARRQKCQLRIKTVIFSTCHFGMRRVEKGTKSLKQKMRSFFFFFFHFPLTHLSCRHWTAIVSIVEHGKRGDMGSIGQFLQTHFKQVSSANVVGRHSLVQTDDFTHFQPHLPKRKESKKNTKFTSSFPSFSLPSFRAFSLLLSLSPSFWQL